MRVSIFLVVFLISYVPLFSQNDVDAIRYSQTGIGGSTRFRSMSGAFGALGADPSCLSYNPAGIGIYQRGEINVSLGLNFSNNNTSFNQTNTKDSKTSFVFSGLGYVSAADNKKVTGDRHAFGIALNQLANFNSNTTIQGASNGKTIMNDLLAQANGNAVTRLDPSYSELAFNILLLDTINANYYGFIPSNANVNQQKTITTSGRINELCLGYTYTIQDKLYLGGSVGIPFITYNYDAVYSETDDKDSIRINNYNYDVWYYTGVGGFKSMSYSENYKTTGSGINLKLGGIYRVNEYVRIGLALHTPTFYGLTDTYLYSMSAAFDEGAKYDSKYPENGGKFDYRIKTPSRIIGSAAFIYKKYGAINIDYEAINYRKATLSSNPNNVFDNVNKTIRSKYNTTYNLRVGSELNIKPAFIRLGYAMYGSPFGNAFTGQFVTSSFSGGVGIRSGAWCFDMGLISTSSSNDYYMYNPTYTDKTTINTTNATFVITLGCKL